MVGTRPQQMLGSHAGVTISQKATAAPCAACKLLRRRCTQDCPFRPYFPPHELHKFASVHKVFGASNVSKMLMEVPEARRVDTANSLIFEASVRLRDPVYGCMGAISTLQRQIQSLHAELVSIKAEILKYKIIEEANNLVAIGSDHISNNFISQSPPSQAYLVSSLASLPHPQQPNLSATTSVAHLIDPTLVTNNRDPGYIINTNADDYYLSRYFR